MWVKLPQGKAFDLSKTGFMQVLGGEGFAPGIYVEDLRSEGCVCLISFPTIREAQHSFDNLWVAIQRHRRDYEYLVPAGTNWIADPALSKPREGDKR